MLTIKEVYELKNGRILLVHTDGSTLSQVNEDKLFADMEKYGAHNERWTTNAYYDVQAILADREA